MYSQQLSGQRVIVQTNTGMFQFPAMEFKYVREQPGIFTTIALAILLVVLIGYSKFRIDKTAKKLEFEQFKNKELKKKLKLALATIKKMETNPDLVHSREFNLDYLRLRMDEERFHYAIVKQIEVKVSQFISVALRPSTAAESTVGIANTRSRKIHEIVDVTYEIESQVGKWEKRVLFRVEIQLTKLPTQSTSTTVKEIMECIENFLCPSESHKNWQPAIQGKLVNISWDQKAKPTPLLVLEQLKEGVNVSYRTNNWRSSSKKQSVFK
ncbi:MAG: hypothetical protein DSM107014_12010 [Gomphosphaeria aponina SAG 52.96 = DSM 107014]|uniref:Uncharacterized protein n=1 Tax=Gomphosphaeria aponina SAG 52.96 = DSM 107014 TaxID=1521640 RepID=A0A941GW71_9CHRO|nr:hypothetical protein [Gomphosphaeria aponina SAG 52.96 = DSM 107014]